jgi:hypothetical protein
MKSWLAAAASAEVLADGLAVVWIDADDMGLAEVVSRLLVLGATIEQVTSRLLYFAPDVPLDATGRADVGLALDAHPVALAVIDAFDPALELQGLDPNVTSEVQRFLREVVGVFHASGIATLIPDHLAKDPKRRGGYPIGSQRKHTGVDVHLGIELIGEPPTRSRPQGRAVLRAHKDRPAWHDRAEGCRIGEFFLDLDGDGPSWRVVLGRSAATETGERGFRPTFLMERVSAYLAPLAEAVSETRVVDDVKGKAAAVRLALKLLVEEGYVEVEEGPRRARLHRLARVYREADDTLADDPDDDSVPDSVPTPSRGGAETTSHSVPGDPPPLRGGPDGTGSSGGRDGVDPRPRLRDGVGGARNRPGGDVTTLSDVARCPVCGDPLDDRSLVVVDPDRNVRVHAFCLGLLDDDDDEPEIFW